MFHAGQPSERLWFPDATFHPDLLEEPELPTGSPLTDIMHGRKLDSVAQTCKWDKTWSKWASLMGTAAIHVLYKMNDGKNQPDSLTD